MAPIKLLLVSIWTEYGFRENPYGTKAIAPSAEGVNLLVGRTGDVRRLHTAITSLDTHPSIEGNAGVGKTSLAQVTAYVASRGAAKGLTGQVLLPLRRVFQIDADSTVASFTREVCYAVVQGFREHRGLLASRGLAAPDVASLDHWISQPLYRSAGGMTPVGGLSRATAPSTTTGFVEDGLSRAVFAWLEDCFLSAEAGAFVCVLDNLELLESSDSARRFLEALRDTLLGRPGLRWILCGARGVLRGAVSSGRLHGVIGAPLELEPLTPQEAGEGLQRRIEAYRMASGVYLPVEPDGFEHLYTLLNRNLRDTFKLCQDFAVTFSGQREKLDKVGRTDRLKLWLQGEGVKYRKAAANLSPPAWRIFDELVSRGGACDLSEWSAFGIKDQADFRDLLDSLARANLIEIMAGKASPLSQQAALTASGWLVHHSRT